MTYSWPSGDERVWITEHRDLTPQISADKSADNAGMSHDAFLRLLSIGVRRYSRDPQTRASSSRAILRAAVFLFAAETSPENTAAECCTDVAEAVRIQRAKQRASA